MTQIEVTQEDVEHGQKGSCTQCPVARAIHRQLIDGVIVYVAGSGMDFYKVPHKSFVGCCHTPPKVKVFIRDFDGHRDPLPFSFNLDIPQELLR